MTAKEFLNRRGYSTAETILQDFEDLYTETHDLLNACRRVALMYDGQNVTDEEICDGFEQRVAPLIIKMDERLSRKNI